MGILNNTGYTNVLSSLIYYINDGILGSIIFTYKSFIPLKAQIVFLSYYDALLNNVLLLKMNEYFLYKNDYSSMLVSKDCSLTLDIILNSTYNNTMGYTYLTMSNSIFFIKFFFFFSNYIVSLLSIFSIFIIFFFMNYKKKIFNPFIILFRKVIWETEQNLVSLEDFFIILSFYIAYVLHFGSLFIPIVKTASYFFKINKFLVIFFSILVGLLPLYFTIKAGTFIFYYIKGVSNDNNIYVSSMNDTMGLLSTLLRYIVQSVRWVLFFLFFFALQIFLYEINYSFIINDSFANGSQNSLSLFGGFNNNLFIYLSYVLFRVIFELLDFLFVAVVQLSAFLVVLFWLLGFLFSSQLPSIFESFFLVYRNNNI